MLSLVFNFVSYKDVNEVLSVLNLHEFVDGEVVQGLLAVARSFLHQDVYDKMPFSQAESIRREVNADLNEFIAPLCKTLGVDKELAIMTIRIKQGDFRILDDFETYLVPFTPKEQIRKQLMGMIGIWTPEGYLLPQARSLSERVQLPSQLRRRDRAARKVHEDQPHHLPAADFRRRHL